MLLNSYVVSIKILNFYKLINLDIQRVIHNYFYLTLLKIKLKIT